MIHHYSPLRYPGGKTKLYPFILDVFRYNNLNDIIYIEPFAGGAGAALELLFLEHVNQIVINDADKNIFSFWKSITEIPDEFVQLISTTKVDVSTWNQQKTVLSNNTSTLLERGFATFYLNRCNISGVISGGIIGGKTQEGTWKIDARFNKEKLIEKIKRISDYRDRIHIYNYDWQDLFDFLPYTWNPENLFFYLDPPYYNKGKDLYMNYFLPNDHVRLMSRLQKLEFRNWILTYDDAPETNSLYKNFSHGKFTLNYSARKKRVANELIVFSSNLQIPDHSNYLEIKSLQVAT